MDDALELVGVDKPYRAAAGVSQPLQLNTPQAKQQQAPNSHQLQQSVVNAGQQMTNSLQGYSQNITQETQQELATIQANEKVQLSNSMQQAQRAAARGDTLSALAQTAAQYLLQRQQFDERKKLETQKKLQEQQKLQQEATDQKAKESVYSLMQEAESKGYVEKGTTTYTQQVKDILEKSGASNETKETLLKEFLQSTTAYDRQVNDRQYSEAKEARTAATEQKKQQLKFELTTVMTELRENKFTSADRVKTLFNEQVQKLDADTTLTQTQKDEVRASLYQQFSQNLEGNIAAKANLDEVQASYNAYRAKETEVLSSVAQGSLSSSEGDAQLKGYRAYYGIPSGDAYDANYGLRQANETKQLTAVPEKTVDNITEKVREAADNKYRIDGGSLNAAAYNLVKSSGGVGLAELRAKPKEKRTATEESLLARAEVLEKQLSEKTKLEANEFEYKQQLAKFNSQTLEQTMKESLRSGTVDPLVQARLQQATSAGDTATVEVLTKLAGGQQLSDAEKAQLESARNDIRSALTQEAQLNSQKLAEVKDNLRQFGLSGDPKKDGEWLRNGVKSFNDTVKLKAAWEQEQTQRALQAEQQKLQPGIANPNLESGVGRNRFPKDVRVDKVRTDLKVTKSFAKDAKTGMLSPFAPETKALITSDWGNRERPTAGASTFHQGVDYGVPAGTPVYAPVDSVVVAVKDQGDDGYGQYITMKGADGMYYRYAHLSRGAVEVQVGDAVPAGAMFAKAGSTGVGTGAHLHLDVRKNDQYDRESSVDPEQYFKTSKVAFTSLSPARNDTGVTYAPIPQGALALTNGDYIYNGQMYKGTVVKQATFTGAKRMNNAYSKPLAKGDKVSNKVTANYGYKKLAQNTELTKALNEVSNELGIKAEWLADIIAFESAGTFSSGVQGVDVAGQGRATGLIQFMPATLKNLGSSPTEAAKMTPTQQMRTLVKKYVADGVRQHGGIRDVAELYLHVFTNSYVTIPRYRKNPSSVMNMSDGHNKFGDIISKLGASVGRQYEVAGITRANRIAKATHTTYKAGCAVCENLRQSGSPIVPHEGQA